MYDYDAIVVGSGAGGGAVAFKLAKAGKKVAIIEAGGFYNTNDFTRFELDAVRKMWWEPRFTSNHELSNGAMEDEIALGMGRCVGGSTTIFTAVAFRAFPENFREWHAATGVVNERGEPISYQDFVPSFERVERETGVARYTDWDLGVQKLRDGFRKLGLPIEPVDAYVSSECDHSGCLFGCPTGAKKGSLLAYIIPALYMEAALLPNSYVTEVLLHRREPDGHPDGRKFEAYGVKFLDEKKQERQLTAKVVILCAGALQTPQILLNSNLQETVGFTKSSDQIGRNLAANTATVVFGRFEDTLNNWEMHPLSAHLPKFSLEKDGGYLLEMSEVMEGPLGFAEVVVDEQGRPLWGHKLTAVMKDYKHMAGIFINIHDQNDGRVIVEKDKEGTKTRLFKPVTSKDLERLSKARGLAREGFHASGASDTYDSILLSHHVQGTCRMGEDVAKTVTNSNCELHDVARLFVGDGSLIPSVVDVNPSLTIYALADRLAEYLVSERCGYLKT